MSCDESASRLGPYVERLLQNAYVQDNLLDAVENLRGAYERAQKRRVEPARDEKIRRQLPSRRSRSRRQGGLKSGRQKPKKRRAKQTLVLVSLGAVGVAAALAASEELRSKLFDSVGQGDDGAPAAASP